ncbi:MAG: discoidin domain-containing protein [Janthinobacterium lividum]
MKAPLPLQLVGILGLLLLLANPLLAQNLNLAYAKTTTASSVESGTANVASNATDGDNGTRWSSEFTDSQSLVVDLGAAQTIDRIRILWEYAFGRNFLLQVSTDALTWTTLSQTTGNMPVAHNGGYLNEYSNLNATSRGYGRYVRLVGTTRNTSFGYSIFEFEVFSFSNTAVSVAAGKTAIASDTEGNNAAGMAVDGDDNTRWSTLNTTNQTLTVDLGQQIAISRIYLSWESAYGVKFSLQSSTDGIAWTTFLPFTNNHAFYNEWAVVTTGRYVRLNGETGGQNGGGFSIWEMKLYGTATPLPVSLTSFRATLAGKTVAVKWTTASEVNNAGFEVQRSANGTDFTALSWVAGAGNSQTMRVYQYPDASPLRPTGYYRLKQLDLSGAATYGPVVAVQLAAGEAVSVSLYPNPTADQATVRWEAPIASAGHWRLTTVTGQVVQEENFAVQPGANARAIDLRPCATGNYWLTLETAGQVLHQQRLQKL